jgi:hypothetical protein
MWTSLTSTASYLSSPTSIVVSSPPLLLLFLVALSLSGGGGDGRVAAASIADTTSEEKETSGLSCSEALHQFLANLSRTYNSEDNSLTVEGGGAQDFPALCGTHHYSLELWRAITVPGAALPPDFGTRDYFSKYQNCDNPNPDLLWKHGDSVKAAVGGGGGKHGGGGSQRLRLNGGGGGLWPTATSTMTSSSTATTTTTLEKVVFYHVVEQQYILRICPCNNSAPLPCSCEHANGNGGSTTCSEIFNISNPYREKVFPWCRGDGSSSIPAPRPQLSAPKLQHCPAQVPLRIV